MRNKRMALTGTAKYLRRRCGRDRASTAIDVHRTVDDGARASARNIGRQRQRDKERYTGTHALSVSPTIHWTADRETREPYAYG